MSIDPKACPDTRRLRSQLPIFRLCVTELREFWCGKSPEESELHLSLNPPDPDIRYGVLGTLETLEAELIGSDIANASKIFHVKGATGLWRLRREEIRAFISEAREDEARVRPTANNLRLPLVALAAVLVLALPITLYLRYGWDDSDLRLASNMAQALDAAASGIVLSLGALISVVLFERQLRLRIAENGLRRARYFIQLIDSHVLSHPDVTAKIRECRASGNDKEHPNPLSDQGVIDYLVFAGGLARVCAKVAVVYSQWLPKDSLIREADELFQISLQIERNCLEKIQLIECRRDRMHSSA